MKSLKYFLALACFIFLNNALLAQSGLSTKNVSVFKNSTAFFIKEGKVKTNNGKFQLRQENMPLALFGTFWIVSPEGKLTHLKTVKEAIPQQKPTGSFHEMLQANIGATALFFITNGEDMESISGKVLSISDNGLVMVEVSGSPKTWESFNVSSIHRLSFLQLPTLTKEHTVEEYLLEVSFSDQSATQPLQMMYLEEGISWSPNYLIEMTSEKKARLTLRAEVKNEAEDILNTSINFVVGVPNFNYADRLAAMVDFADRPSGRSYRRESLSNAAFSQQINYMDSRGASDIIGPGVIIDDEDSRNEDLYFYSVKDFSLPKGGRGQFPIFSSEIEIEHLYEVNLSANSTSSSYYQKNMRISAEEQNKVFHSIKIPNSTAYPWTTGTAMVMNATGSITKPISQDLLKYTPPTGTTFVKLTVAPDIRVLDGEKELSREVKKVKWRDNYSYDLVTVEGQVKLKNYKDKDVKLSVVRSISGATKKSDLPWKVEEAVNVSSRINKTTEICWDLTLKAGEEKTITYTYEVYVRY